MTYPGAHAEVDPDRPAVIMASTGEVVTYAELNDRSNQLAQLFWDRGLRPGDHIASFMENNAWYHIVAWAALRSGLHYTAVNSHLNADEVEYIVDDCGATAFVTSVALAPVAVDMSARTPRVHTRLVFGGELEGYESLEKSASTYPAESLAEELEGSPMLYSSGTTGRPKGIKLPMKRMPIGTRLTVTYDLLRDLGFGPGSVYLSTAPLYHGAPMGFTTNVHRLGGTVVVMERFKPEVALELIEKYKVTHSQWVPTMFVRMLKLPAEERARFDLSSHKAAVHAAAPIPIPVKMQMIEWWGPILHEYYAGTEGNGFVYCDSEQWLAHPGTVGHATVGVLHIVGEDGEELRASEPGVIYFEGGGNFEYHNDPEKTAASRHAKGWSTLGDVGYVDEDGYLYLTDRKAFMIISGGVNIYPQEAENLLVTHPRVVDVAVFGVPNEEFGEEVKCVVQPADPSEAGPELEAELIAFCKANLASYKCPKSVDFESDLPRLPTGKLYKRGLRERYWKGRETRIV